MNRFAFLIAAALALIVRPVAAHHGDEFFVLEDYEIPSLLGGHLSAEFDWEKYNSADEFGTETMLMLTIAPQVALSVSGNAMDHGDGWRYSSVTPRFHVQLTPPKWDFPLRVSFSFGYQFVDGAAGGETNRKASVVTYEKVYEQVPYGYTVTTANPPSPKQRPQRSNTPATTTISVPVTSSVPVTIETPVTVTTTTSTSTTTSSTTTGPGTGTGDGSGGYDPSVDVDYVPPQPPHEGHDHADTSSTSTTVTTTVTTTKTTTETPSQTTTQATAQVVNQTTSKSATTASTGTAKPRKSRPLPATSTTTYTGTTTKVKTVKRVTQVVETVEAETSDSIHNHDENLWTGRLVVEADFGKTKALFNLIGLAPEGEEPVWGYAVGVRRQITHSFGLGVEAIGDFASDGMHEVVLGGYLNPAHSLTMKIGAGFGLTEASSDFSLRTGFTWRF